MWRLYLIGMGVAVVAWAGSLIGAYTHGKSVQKAKDDVATLQSTIASQKAVIAAKDADAKAAAHALGAFSERALKAETDLAAARGELETLEAERNALPVAPSCGAADPAPGPAPAASPPVYRCPLSDRDSRMLNGLASPRDRPADPASPAR